MDRGCGDEALMRVLLTDRGLLNGYTLGLASGLRAAGVDVLVAGPSESDVRGVAPIYRSATATGQVARKLVDATRGAGRFYRLLAGHPDLVQFQWPRGADMVFALSTKQMYGIPIAFTVHNFRRALDGSRYEANQDRLIDIADLVFTHGPGLRDAIVTEHPSAAHKTHVMEIGNYGHVIQRHPRAQARAELGLPLDEPVYVFVGQIRPRKGVEVLLEAFVEHRERGGKGRLFVAGAPTVPDYERSLLEIVRRCPEAVDWPTGRQPLPQRTLDLALSAANMVVLPFSDASQSAALILALTHGRCVVSTAVGEVPRTLEGRGMVVAPGDRSAIVDALEMAERSPEVCDDLGARARAYALAELSWVRIGRGVADLYRGVAA
jgi:glycosyltransferase involved in cell wall biosynthesis